ncbi:ABC transporter ATP-binding protein, partial [Candidatus Saccharibacteria bacterium]|nr:ABC transporter ATP-binding protein [Candidatus Saccharibacteria bacterium]
MNRTKEIFYFYLDASKKHPKDFYFSFLNPISSIASNVALPFFAGKVLASISLQDGTFSANITYLIVSVIASVGFNRLGFLALMRLQAKVMRDLSVSLFDKIMHRGLRFHTNNIGGKLVSEAFDFLQSYLNLSGTFFASGASLLLTLTIGLLVVFLQSWQLGFFLLIVIGGTMFWTYLDSKRRSRLRSIRHK